MYFGLMGNRMYFTDTVIIFYLGVIFLGFDHVLGVCTVNKIQDERLEGNWLKSETVRSPYSCNNLCWYLKDCKSTNLNTRTNECELKSKTMTTAPYSIRRRKKEIHLEVKSALCQNTKHACASQPCQEHEICIPVRGAAEYLCLPAYKTNGGFTKWTVSSEELCPVTCGGATVSVRLTRTCTNPAPANGGQPCAGLTERTETRICNPEPCKVDGAWTPWRVTSVGTCSLSCGGGKRKVRSRRSCRNPRPAHGGAECPGADMETTEKECNTHVCSAIVDGGWTEWSLTREPLCPVTCGGGTRVMTRERYCDNPTPQGSGSPCIKTDGTADIVETEDFNDACGQAPCPVDGAWAAWVDVVTDECSVSCGGGSKVTYRKRKCQNPAPSAGGEYCKGETTRTEETECNIQQCPVDGMWGEWRVTSVGACSKPCGTGQRSVISERSCSDPPAAFGGAPCEGLDREEEVEECNTHKCAAVVDGGWSRWVWTSGPCTKTCGYGTKTRTRTRTCSNPAPANGGKTCVGNDKYEYQGQCSRFRCQVDGGWSDWAIWWSRPCTRTCGGGVQLQYKYRWCNNPRRSWGGAYCVGSRYVYEEGPCNVQPCPVDGGWAPWTIVSYGTCTATCGGGSRKETSQRECTNPSPEHDGADCPGPDVKHETKDCNMHDCASPINGGWSAWEFDDQEPCSVSCGAGTLSTTRVRSCSNPFPANGGNACPGTDKDVAAEPCNDGECPVHGTWSVWGAAVDSACSVSCGGGTMTSHSTRTCNNPAPKNGGDSCAGSANKIEIKPCGLQACPVDGNWGPWSVTSGTCSVSCGGGTITRTYQRSCDSPAPVGSGSLCDGALQETKTENQPCNTDECRVDGNWSDWVVTSWSTCPASCSYGDRPVSYIRTCDNPAPAFGGNDCAGSPTQSGTVRCAVYCSISDRVNGEWSPWIRRSATACTKSCGGGVITAVYERVCDNPKPNGGVDCAGESTKTEDVPCNTADCPVSTDGGWSDWINVERGTCSVTCGNGARNDKWTRECNNPPPSNGGATCQGGDEKQEETLCNKGPCPVDGGWSEWKENSRGDCTKSCGGGTETVQYVRECSNPSPKNGGAQCPGANTREVDEPCNIKACDVKCPKGWKKAAEFSMCYKYEAKERTWSEARAKCQTKDNTDLVIFTSLEMQEFFFEVIEDKDASDVHIGGYYDSGSWLWVRNGDKIDGFSKSGATRKCLKVEEADDELVLDHAHCERNYPSICQMFG